MIRIKWPVALATLFVGLLGWYLVYTQQIVRALRADAETLTQIFTAANEAIADTVAGSEIFALFELRSIVIGTELPLVLTTPRLGAPGGDSVLDVMNLPFPADLLTQEGQETVLSYVSRLDARHQPVGDSLTQLIHWGDTPPVRTLRWIGVVQAIGLLLTAVVGFTVIRAQRSAESEKAWTAMARELAHQLGTPLSSLQGWLEVLRLTPAERPGDVGEAEIASSIEEDLVRLERISHRFELIGREPELRRIDLHTVVRDLQEYLGQRLPRLGAGVQLEIDVPEDLPEVQGSEVLLAWALENIVKNALDALAGRGGTIGFRARWEGRWVNLRIRDTGPGVAVEIRDKLFEPGVTTKSGGWGVGLALSRRIVEGVHGGRIELLDGREGGTTFEVLLPVAS